MENGLPCAGPCVEDNPVATGVDSLGFRHPVSLGGNLGEKSWLGSGQRRQVGIVILRDDQDVRGCLRVDIPEGERACGLGNPLGGNITRHDPAKEAVCHPVILACDSPER